MEEEVNEQFNGSQDTVCSVAIDAIPFRPPYEGSQRQTQSSQNHPTAIHLSTPMDAICYNMRHKLRGKALIINFMTFNPSCGESNILEKRKGSEIDLQELVPTLEGLKFHVEVCDTATMTVQKLKQKLEEVSLEDHSNSDCLLVVVMTHGLDETLWASDSTFTVRDLWQPFTTDNCYSLAGKPKLFFIQACRGNELASGTWLRDEQAATERVPYTIPTQCDILITHSTFEGNASVRNTKSGSWFIQSLCKELSENGKRMSLLLLLTSVIRRVAIHHGLLDANEKAQIRKQQPVIVSTLSRDLYFEE